MEAASGDSFLAVAACDAGQSRRVVAAAPRFWGQSAEIVMRRPQVIHIQTGKRLAAQMLGVAAMFLRTMRRPPQAPAKRVVIFEPFGLGDVISHEPLVRTLRQNGFEVAFCGGAVWKTILPEVRWVDAEAAWGGHARQEKYRVGAYIGAAFRDFVRRLRRESRGAIGIDTRGDIRSVLMLYLAGCSEVFTLGNYLGSDLKMSGAAAKIVPFEPELQRWAMNLKFAEHLGCRTSATEPKLGHLVFSPAVNSNLVGLMPVAPWAGKWWVPERWRKVAEGLRSRGFDVFGMCGPGQAPLAREHLGNVAITECTSIDQWAKEIQRARFLITLDSGPMHLATALDVPVIALFGQGLLPMWAPAHRLSEVVTHQHDADFHVRAPIEGNTENGREFMHRISVQEVLAAVDRVVAKLNRR